MKILIVDREMFLAELVKLALEADGHECVTAAGFDEASDFLGSEPIDFVILDLHACAGSPLEWLDGVVLAHPELHGRVFVLADRLLEPDESSRVLACGARVVRKPFTLHQVRETVDMMAPLEGRRADPRHRRSEVEV